MSGYIASETLSYLSRSVAGFSLRKPRFSPVAVRVGCMSGNVAQGLAFSCQL
jgi:hypothetical protein